MGNAVRNADIAGDSGVAQAQTRLDSISEQWVEIGKEAGLLVASSSPVGGQIADGISLASNLSSGNYGGALVDAIGFIPFGGDAFKGLVRGSSIARRTRRINNALSAARSRLSRAQTFARRRVAASDHWAAIKRRRQAIKNKYKNCRTGKCADERDELLRKESRLPAKEKGDWVDKNGNRVPAGQGFFKPKEGTPLHSALSQHQKPVEGIPYTDGKPDLSGFPPRGRHNSRPDGKPYQVEIDQSLGEDKGANQTADRNAAWGQWRQNNPNARKDPSGAVSYTHLTLPTKRIV